MITLVAMPKSGELAFIRHEDGKLYHHRFWHQKEEITEVPSDEEEQSLYGAVRHDWDMVDKSFIDWDALHNYRRGEVQKLLDQVDKR